MHVFGVILQVVLLHTKNDTDKIIQNKTRNMS